MKKFSAIMMAALLALVLAGCGANKNNDTKNNNANDNNAVEDGVNNNDNNEAADNNNNGTDNGVDHNGESRLDVADDAAEKVAELDEVDAATVILTDNNAYVGVMMSNNDNDATDNGTNAEDELSKELEDKISEKVREVKGDIDNVYVSLNPDFVSRMTDYRTRINEGEPIEGLFDEFGEAVRNVFPDAH